MCWTLWITSSSGMRRYSRGKITVIYQDGTGLRTQEASHGRIFIASVMLPVGEIVRRIVALEAIHTRCGSRYPVTCLGSVANQLFDLG